MEILRNPLVGLVCSVKCPGSVVIKTFDAIRRLRDKRVVFVGGFHSPMERDCLDLLLRGDQPAILCPARGLRNPRMGAEARKAVSEGRLLVLSFFEDEIRRTTARRSLLRNEIVAALAEAVLVPHASKNGKIWSVARRALGCGKRIFTFADEANADLLACGADVCREERICDLLNETKNRGDRMNPER